MLGDFGKVKAWGSISTGAFDLARRLGCDPIVFVGQDLSFPNLRYYAHGTYQERRWLREIGHGKSLQDMHNWRMSNENDLDAVDIFGRPGRTSKALEAYRQYLEREIAEAGVHVINATGGGVGLMGWKTFRWRRSSGAMPAGSMRSGKLSAGCRGSRTNREKRVVYTFLTRSADELDSFCKTCNEGFELARLIHQGQARTPRVTSDRLRKFMREFTRAGMFL